LAGRKGISSIQHEAHTASVESVDGGALASFGNLATDFWQRRQPCFRIVKGDEGLSPTLGKPESASLNLFIDEGVANPARPMAKFI
jgi:hypothetical protein